jgi:hypothetical protein
MATISSTKLDEEMAPPPTTTTGPPIPTTIMSVPLDLLGNGTTPKAPVVTSSAVNGSSVEQEGLTTTTAITSKQVQRKMVAVRYFLDRPGYGLHNSAVRLWMDPPTICVSSDIQNFLIKNGIVPDSTEDGVGTAGGNNSSEVGMSMSLHDSTFENLHDNEFLVEVYLEKFQSFMLLQACEDSKLEWNLSNSTINNPSTFNIRFTFP